MKQIDRDELTKLLGEGLTPKELAEHFGVSPPTIWSRCRKWGLKPPPRRKGFRKQVDRAEMRKLVRKGLTLEELGKHFGVSISTIRSRCLKWRLRVPATTRKEYKPLLGRYVSDEELLGLMAEGLSVEGVASRLGTSAYRVRKALKARQIPLNQGSKPLPKDTLNEMYHGSGMTAREVAASLGVSVVHVLRQMKKHGIKRRSQGIRKKNREE